MNVLKILKRDHSNVQNLFGKFDRAGKSAYEKKGELFEKIRRELQLHSRAEEEIFYPAARKATGDNDLLDEALVEHAGAKHLISEIESMKVGDDLYDAKIRVLGEQIKHHVKEEEEELFPEIESSDMDVAAVGKQLADRKAKLMATA